jgi:hypothetical protein
METGITRWTVLVCLFAALAVSTQAGAQKKEDFPFWEDSLVRLHAAVIAEQDPILRYQQNEHLLYCLEMVLLKKNSIHYPFSALKTISVVCSEDKKIRLFTWYLIDGQGRHEHYGYLQAFHPKKEIWYVYPLIDKWTKMPSGASLPLSPNNWYGAVYYKLIENRTSSKTCYTLLGWNGGDLFVQRRVIEIVSFSPAGTPVFGAPVFKGYGNGRPLRILFDHAKTSSMGLAWQEQYYVKKSSSRDPKTRKYVYDTLQREMIVFNRLIPMDDSLEEIPAFMVSEASLTDAFFAENGKWVFKPDVIALNRRVLPSKAPPGRRTHYHRQE